MNRGLRRGEPVDDVAVSELPHSQPSVSSAQFINGAVKIFVLKKAGKMCVLLKKILSEF